MRFILGLLLGFSIGFGGAILFAPEKRRTEAKWPEGHPASVASVDGDRSVSGSVQSAFRTLQEHVNQAWDEARKAAKEAEREMQARYEEMSRGKAATKK